MSLVSLTCDRDSKLIVSIIDHGPAKTTQMTQMMLMMLLVMNKFQHRSISFHESPIVLI